MLAGTSASGRRTLLPTFLRPQTYLLWPSTFLVEYSVRPFGSSTLIRTAKGLTLRSDGHWYVGPRYRHFDKHLAIRGILAADVQLDKRPRVVIELARLVDQAAKRAKHCPILVAGIPKLSHVVNEATWLEIIHRRLYSFLHEDERFIAGSDARWTNQPDLATRFHPRLTQPKPDITYAFFGSPWKDIYPMASKSYQNLIFPHADMAVPFFVSVGKGKGKETEGEKVAVNQNLNSTFVALHNLRELKYLASTVIEGNSHTEHPLPPLISGQTTSRPPCFNTLSQFATQNQLNSSSSNADFVIVSAVVTTKKVHLDAHWTAIGTDPAHPEYYRARLATWQVVEELYRSSAGITAAVKHVRSALEPRLHSYMSVLEADCRKTKKVAQCQELKRIDSASSLLVSLSAKLEDIISSLSS